MKKLVLAAMMLVFSVGVNAACTSEDLQGEWNFKFIAKSPPQVGICKLSFHSDTSVTGSCDNITYDLSTDVFDGTTTVSSNCIIKGKIIDEQGGTTTITAKLNADTRTLSGTAIQKVGGRTFKGTLTATRVGDAVCK